MSVEEAYEVLGLQAGASERGDHCRSPQIDAKNTSRPWRLGLFSRTNQLG